MRAECYQLIAIAMFGHAALQASETTVVSVCLSDSITPVQSQEFQKAVLNRIFQRAAIRISWTNCDNSADGTSAFSIRVIERAPATASAQALAATHLSRSAITIFNDRVQL